MLMSNYAMDILPILFFVYKCYRTAGFTTVTLNASSPPSQVLSCNGLLDSVYSSYKNSNCEAFCQFTLPQYSGLGVEGLKGCLISIL